MLRDRILVGSLISLSMVMVAVSSCGPGQNSKPRTTILLGGGNLAQFNAYSPNPALTADELTGDRSDTNFKPVISSVKAAADSASIPYSSYYATKNTQNALWATQSKATYVSVGSLTRVFGYTFYTDSKDIREIEHEGGILPHFTGHKSDFVNALQDEVDGITPSKPFDGNLFNPYFQSFATDRTAFVTTTTSPIVAKGWTKDTSGSFSDGWVYLVYARGGFRLPHFNVHPWDGSAHPKAGVYEQQILIPESVKLSDIAGYVQVKGGKFTGQVHLSDDLKTSDPTAFNKALEFLSGKNTSTEFDAFPADQTISDIYNSPSSKVLGGTTKPKLGADPSTNIKYVIKDPANNPNIGGAITLALAIQQSEMEVLADSIYRAAGVLAPPSKFVQLPSGQKYKYSVFIPEAVELADLLPVAFPGRTFAHPTGKSPDPVRSARAMDLIKKDFAMDVLLGGWDVTGYSGYNVMVDKFNNVWRIDNGATFEFLATGALKKLNGRSNFDDIPSDLFFMRAAALPPAKPYPSFHFFNTLTYPEIIDQLREVVKKKAIIVAAAGAVRSVRNPGTTIAQILATRMDYFSYLIAIYDILHAAGKADVNIEAYSNQLTTLIKAQVPAARPGVTPALPAIVGAYGAAGFP